MEPEASGTAADLAYHRIKSWILAGDIPLRARLAEERVAAKLSMSRTPVREALLRLFAERFVERHPEGGYRISHPTAKTMNELYDVRKALELFAAGATAAAVASGSTTTTAELEDLRDEWAALEGDAPDHDPDFVAVDEDFHRRIAVASGNGELVATLDRVCERIRPVRTHDFTMSGRIDETIAQHVAIAEALLEGSPEAATLLERHIKESQMFVELAVGRVLERMLTLSEEELFA